VHLSSDQVPDRRVRDHDLESEGASFPLALGMRICEMTPPDEGELRADLRLLCREGNVEDPVDRLDARVRVEGGEHEVAGLRHGERAPRSFPGPHLADEDDVGILPKDVFQRLLEPLRVGVDLPLVHEALFVRVEILDRVLDGDDVLLRSLLILSIIGEGVDFPDPVGRSPDQPPGFLQSSFRCGGSPSSRRDGPGTDGAEGAGDGRAACRCSPGSGRALDAKERSSSHSSRTAASGLGQDAVAERLCLAA